MKTLPFYLFTFLLFILSGCIEEYEADIPAEDSNLLVVEGTICSGKVNTFVLSRTQAIHSSYTPRMVTGAIVSVRGSDGSDYVTQASNGVYSCWISSLNPDVEYWLHIENDGEVFESEPQKPLRSELVADVRGVQNTPESDIDILVTPDTPFESDRVNYYTWTYDETWEVHPNITTEKYFDIDSMLPRKYNDSIPNPFPERGWKDAASTTTMLGSSTNYEGQHIQRLKLYDISRSSERIYHRYSGLIHQRAISKGEYEYELARRQASSEMGGLFTPQPSSLPTNIHCLTSGKRAIGFVGCSLNTCEYRFYLNGADFSINNASGADCVWQEFVGSSDSDKFKEFLKQCRDMVLRGFFLCVWEDNRDDPTGKLRVGWTDIYQLDVRYKGAYIEKPEFWED